MVLLLRILKFVAVRMASAILLCAVLVAALVCWQYATEQYRKASLSQQLRMEALRMELELLQMQNQAPNALLHPVQYAQYQAKLEAQQALLAQKKQLAEAARAAKDSLVMKLTQALKSHKMFLLWALLLLFFGRPLWKTTLYFGLAGLLDRASPMRFSCKQEDETSRIEISTSQSECVFLLDPGKKLYARMNAVRHREAAALSHTRMLWRWSSFWVSMAAQLAELTVWALPDTAEAPAELILSAGNDPDAQTMALQLKNSPGVVLKPQRVLAVSDGIEVRSSWHFTWHNLCAFRLRHIVFYGTGVIFISGQGSVVAHPADGKAFRVEDPLLIGYESTLAFRLVRTETFWAYLRGKAALFDDSFQGSGICLTHRVPPGNQNGATEGGLTRFLEVLLNGIGKILGF